MTTPVHTSGKKPKIRLLLVDDHVLVSQGLELMLSSAPSIRIVGVARTAEEAVRKVTKSPVDVVLMDVKLDGHQENGIDALRRIKQLAPDTRVIMLSMFTDPATVTDSVRAGADGYMSKVSSKRTLLQAIKEVSCGKSFLDPNVTEGMFGQVGKNASALTQRELQVLQYFALGKSTRDVAWEIHISEETVKSYLKQVFRKLRVHDRTEAVAEAIRRGLIH